PQEETRSAIAFHLWRESGSFYNRFARGTAEEVRGLGKIFTEGHEGKRRGSFTTEVLARHSRNQFLISD
ncbi:MAG: hypothetical protein WCG03_04060, partial [Kiritimatiellales bacterium]